MVGCGKRLYLLLSQVDYPTFSIPLPFEGHAAMTFLPLRVHLRLTLPQGLRCYGNRIADGTARHI